MYLFDTDIIIDFLKKKTYAEDLISTLLREGSLYTSVVSLAELRVGWNTKQTEFFLPRITKLFTLHDITPEIAEYAGYLRREYMGKGSPIALMDTFIAATAIHHDLMLITRNIKHYPFKQLHLYEIGS